MITRRNNQGFSLVEVVLALGIFVFAGIAMVGLLAVGLRSGSDSKQQFQAATIAEALCSTRRAAPTANVPGTQPNFPLPVLSTTANNISSLNPIYLTWNGGTTTPANGDARFGLLYSITAPTGYTPPVAPEVASVSPGTAKVYLYIYWPPQAPPAAAGTGHFEVTTTIALP